MTDKRPILTLITGADRGIGFETAMSLAKKGQHILLGSRNMARGKKAVDKIRQAGYDAELLILDVTDQTDIDRNKLIVNEKFGYLDTLINNAGIALDNHEDAVTLSTNVIRKEFDVNFFGTVSMIQAFIPLLKRAKSGKIINVSSNMGSLKLASDPNSKFYNVSSLGYQSSKAAVNFATITFAKELADTNITVNSVNPGWTATAFGGRDTKQPVPDGMQTVQEGARQIVKLASDPRNDLNGTFTENDGSLPW